MFGALRGTLQTQLNYIDLEVFAHYLIIELLSIFL